MKLDVIIAWGLVISAIITIWAVLTPNHLYIG